MSKSVALLLILVFITASSIIIAKPASSETTTENSWTTKASMPQAISGVRAAVVNEKIYVMASSYNYEYDPAMNTWISKTPMPTARRYFGIAVYENKIYAIGGSLEWDRVSGNVPSDANEVYDPLTDTWETKEPMPTNRSGIGASVVNGKIYLIGGRTVGPQYLTVVLNEVYDTVTNSWTTKAPIPIAVHQYASAVIGNKIYVIGGQAEFHDPLNIGSNQIYDAVTDTWSEGASLPTVVWNAAAGVTTGIMALKRIYVVGGTPDGSIGGTNITQAYDPENDVWTFGVLMPTARAWLAVAVVDDMLYAIGGSPGLMLSFLTANEQYAPFGYGTPDPSYDVTPPTVTLISPENRTYHETSVPLKFLVSEPVSWMRYELDNENITEISGNTTIAALSFGAHNLTVSAIDDTGSMGVSETIHFSVEEPFPTLTVAAAVACVIVIGLGLFVYFKKRKH